MAVGPSLKWYSEMQHVLQVRWHRSLEEVPKDAPAIFIAHEFFDALPVHQFQKTERGWCERLVDTAGHPRPHPFRHSLSRGEIASQWTVCVHSRANCEIPFAVNVEIL